MRRTVKNRTACAVPLQMNNEHEIMSSTLTSSSDDLDKTFDGLLASVLSEQQDLTAVERFAQWHDRTASDLDHDSVSQAPALALQHLASAGYRTQQARSDWIIEGTDAAEMQLAMIEGMAAAALEQEPAAQAAVQLWKARRVACVAASRLRVGHVDIVATLA